MPEAVETKWPVLARHDRALEWLRIWTDLGRAPRTIDAYARGLAEYLQVCEREGIDPLAATRAQVAVFVRELTSRPSRRGTNVVALDSGSGLANATLQQRLVPVRLFYDFLVEEGVRESNPVGRGRYTPGGRSGGRAGPLVPRMVKLPWIPSEAEWLRLLGVVAEEPIRNRVMLALAYDAALRREELCSLRSDDLDPAHRTLRVRAETTKTRRERVVPYSAPTGVLLSEYLQHRATLSRARGGLFLSESRRNHAEPAHVVDVVEGGAANRVGGQPSSVLHPYHAAPVPDGSGPDGLGAARDRHVRRAPQHRLHAAVHPPVRAGLVGEAELLHGADPRVADRHAHRTRRRTGRSGMTAVAPAWPAGTDRGRPSGHLTAGRSAGTAGSRCSTARPRRWLALGPVGLRRNGPWASRDGRRHTGMRWPGLIEPLDATLAGLHHGEHVRLPTRRCARGGASVLQHCADYRPQLVGLDAVGVGAAVRRQRAGVRHRADAADRADGAAVRRGSGLPARRVHRLPPAGHVQSTSLGLLDLW